MNPRIAKEIRALLPAFGLILAAAVAPIVYGPNRHELPEIWMGILFCMGCVIMGAEIFGNEFQQRTVGQLLAQPMSRTAIWKEKMLVLGVALLIGACSFWITVVTFDSQMVSENDVPWVACALFPIAVLCTVPCWTLFFQSTLLGMLVAVGAPILMLAANSLLHTYWLRHEHSIAGVWFVANDYIHQHWARAARAEENSVITLIVLYCIAGCWFGYRQFKNLQVVSVQSQLVSREMQMPRRLEALLLWPFRMLSTGLIGQFGSLLKKELRLQFVSFLGAATFCLITFALAVVYQLSGEGRSRLDFVPVVMVGSFIFFIPLLPLIAGAVAVAEEKAWGVAGWHLTLPPSALKQWVAKILATLSTGFVLGLLLPVVWAVAGSMFFGVQQQDSDSLPRLHSLRAVLNSLVHGDPNGLASMSLLIQFAICVVLIHTFLTSIAIYAGALSKTTARALVLALGMVFGISLIVWFGIETALSRRESMQEFLFNQWPSIRDYVQFHRVLVVTLVLLLCLIHPFAYRWFRMRATPRSLGLQLPLLALVIFLCALMSALFWY